MTEFEFQPRAKDYDPHNAVALGRAAKLAYESQEAALPKLKEWGFSKVRFLDSGDTQGFVGGSPEMILVAFRGTEASAEDIKSDLKLRLTSGPAGEVHRGFHGALDHVWEECKGAIEEFREGDQPLWLTGHSLGAALATLAAARLTLKEGQKVDGVYTFGSPRVGETAFARAYNAALGARTFRFKNNNDVVTRVPIPALFRLRYRHVGSGRYFDSQGRLRPKISAVRQLLDRVRGRVDDLGQLGTDGMKDHAMDRYLALLVQNANAS